MSECASRIYPNEPVIASVKRETSSCENLVVTTPFQKAVSQAESAPKQL
jgi:hypothetical protein